MAEAVTSVSEVVVGVCVVCGTALPAVFLPLPAPVSDKPRAMVPASEVSGWWWRSAAACGRLVALGLGVPGEEALGAEAGAAGAPAAGASAVVAGGAGTCCGAAGAAVAVAAAALCAEGAGQRPRSAMPDSERALRAARPPARRRGGRGGRLRVKPECRRP